jgi:hypothetical protein
MGRAAMLGRSQRSLDRNSPAAIVPPASLLQDERWALAQRIAGSRHFSRSPLLSKFLLFTVAETLEGRAEEITEHAIGVRVFDRPSTYRTVEDNIVRNYARQLRKRLTDYYAGEGSEEPCRIEMPLGGYVPHFRNAAEELAPMPMPVRIPSAFAEHPQPAAQKRKWFWAACVAIYTVVIVAAAWLASAWIHTRHPASSITDPLWQAMLQSPGVTYIVPSDSGFNLLEDLHHQALPLADYIDGNYLAMPLTSLNSHTSTDLRGGEYTSYAGMKIILALQRLPQWNPARDQVRFPRSLHLDDLKNGNVILIGSEDSNPWASLAQQDANFRILDDQGMQGARILNTHPNPGEAASYVSHWNQPAHETYALIEYMPNLSGAGHTLLLQGLDVAGTQAAAEALLHPSAIAPVIEKALRSDGTLRPFEILLRATSIASNAAGTQVVSYRIH